ncbi:MAG TPA: ATP-binding protein, partial [Chitinophagaceae bacterium]|nr:ATP-binding protein [Chitinophagaceae bacterium]
QYILEGSVKRTWDAFLFVETELSRLPSFVIDNMRGNDKVYLSASFNNFGCLTLATLEPLSDEQFDIMLRFAKVFDLTYTRFNDLKQAEAQAREARIEAALERVRARALAMQEPEELKDVAHILRTEMGLLGVEELETCSIYINDESAEKAECWYALKDISSEEKKLVNDHFALNLRETWVGREMLRFYQSPQKQISIVMQGENRKEWIRYCEEHSAPFRGYYGEVIPDRTYHLYKFSHGAIGAAAAGDISEESWRMLSRAASVFTLAYSRFKDLTQARTDLIKLKEEKKRAEEALTELQATQKQLIQSEKMASLGELTAGIAHEIQNPLNFVNNFSDVSNELLEEMKQELATGNTQQAIEIVNGVKENLEKILHHGKRADAIVKGMLQHSRSSSGQKELTDINTLAEEYLRLAYHGLRAKDKFFNAKFETNLDPSLGKINVVPQEIGRVILNLINNAFYAVTEKKKSLAPSPKGVQEKTTNDYEPMVAVTTKRLGSVLGDRGSVEIRITDNGNGIPQKVLDKIFQPFFTTKPTGQGTGLGLSLSYDIITKGHQGEIKVDTKEGEGTEFTIILPMN